MKRLVTPLSRLVLSLTLLLGAAALTGCTTDRAVISQANQFHGSLEPTVIEDPVLNGYIQRVGDRIIRSAQEVHLQQSGEEDRSWMFSEGMQFHLVNSDTVNAFTTGGNHMYVYTGLFIMSETEDELAAVMAHEFAHVYGRHVQKGMDRQYGMLGTGALGAVAGYLLGGDDHGMEYAGYGAAAGMVTGQLVGMGFTRRDEAEADALGFNFYVRAGWDPDRFSDFFQRMIDEGYDKGGAFGEFLSDHPSLSSRVEASGARADDLPPNVRQQLRRPPVATPQEFGNLQQRAKQVSASMPQDRTLEASRDLLQALPRSCLTPAVTPEQKQAAERLEQRVAEKQSAEQGKQR